jgi:hypothetical protein
LDVWRKYNLFQIAEEKELVIAFLTWYRLFKSLVMLFRLMNTWEDFQHFINDILWLYLNIFALQTMMIYQYIAII